MPTSHSSAEEFDVKVVNHFEHEEATSFSAMSGDDKKSVFILLLLYTLQGEWCVCVWCSGVVVVVV
jgi:hypothetical protein